MGTPQNFPTETRCPLGTTTVSGASKITDCQIAAVDVCDKTSDNYYYAGYSYTLNGKQIAFGIDAEVVALHRVNPINVAASVPYWKNTTVAVTGVCPTHVRLVSSGTLITIFGYRFLDVPTLTCQFVNTHKADGTVSTYTEPAQFLTAHTISCMQPSFDADGSATVQVSLYGQLFAPSSITIAVILNRPEATRSEIDQCSIAAMRTVVDPTDNDLHRYFELRGFSFVQMMIDWQHIPKDPTYGVDFKLAIYVSNSICVNRICNAQNVPITDTEATMTSPCRKPVPFSAWFSSPTVSKATLFNVTMFALEDTVFHVEVQILNGLYAALLPLFANTVTVQIFSPSRANVTFGVAQPPMRRLGSAISFERAPVVAEFVFLAPLEQTLFYGVMPPTNLPPRFQKFETGRVLTGFNVSRDAAGIPLGDVKGLMDMSTDSAGAPVMPWFTVSYAHVATPADYWQVCCRAAVA
jgi:hypothetical protein